MTYQIKNGFKKRVWNNAEGWHWEITNPTYTQNSINLNLSYSTHQKANKAANEAISLAIELSQNPVKICCKCNH